MVPLPPPPDLSSRSGAGAARPPMGAPHATAPVHARPGQLTVGWRWVLLLGWGSVVIGLMAVGAAGDVLGKRAWWLDGALVVVPFLIPMLAALAAYANSRWAIWIGLLGVASLAATAVLDRTDSPGVAAATGVLALIGALTTVSSIAGRVPPFALEPGHSGA
ncbi:MAG: hypothetical protein AB7Q42_02370 [Acidimicrobiia bacterium]